LLAKKPKNTADNQIPRVIVDDFREQARSYSRWAPPVGGKTTDSALID
jgi:hypothetical protein